MRRSLVLLLVLFVSHPAAAAWIAKKGTCEYIADQKGDDFASYLTGRGCKDTVPTSRNAYVFVCSGSESPSGGDKVFVVTSERSDCFRLLGGIDRLVEDAEAEARRSGF